MIYSFNYSMFFSSLKSGTYVLMMNPDLLCSTIFSPHNFDADPKDISLWTRRSKWGLTWHSGPVWIQMLPPHHPRQSDRDLKTQVGKKLWNKCVADRHNYGCRTLIFGYFLFILANLVFNLVSDDPVTKKCVANCGNPPTPLPLTPTTFIMNEKIVFFIK